MSLYEPPVCEILVAFFVVIGVAAAVRGARRLWRGLHAAVPLDLVRGIRDFVIALAAAACTAWILSREPGFLILGVLVLGEEFYETALLTFVIRGDQSLD